MEDRLRAGRTDKMTAVPLNPFPAAAQARPEHRGSASAHLSLSLKLLKCLCATVRSKYLLTGVGRVVSHQR